MTECDERCIWGYLTVNWEHFSTKVMAEYHRKPMSLKNCGHRQWGGKSLGGRGGGWKRAGRG